jgi:hypothetical protein
VQSSLSFLQKTDRVDRETRPGSNRGRYRILGIAPRQPSPESEEEKDQATASRGKGEGGEEGGAYATGTQAAWKVLVAEQRWMTVGATHPFILQYLI